MSESILAWSLFLTGTCFYSLILYRSWVAKRQFGRWPWYWTPQSALEKKARRNLWLGYFFLHVFMLLYIFSPATVQQIFNTFLPWHWWPLRVGGVFLIACGGCLWFWLTWRMQGAWHIGINPQVRRSDYRSLELLPGFIRHPIYVLLSLMTILSLCVVPLWLLLPVVFLSVRGWYLQACAEDEFWSTLET